MQIKRFRSTPHEEYGHHEYDTVSQEEIHPLSKKTQPPLKGNSGPSKENNPTRKLRPLPQRT
jgi:hypothetical protein